MVNSSGFRLMMMYSRAFLAVSVLVDLSAFIAVASTAVSEIPGTLGILVIMKIFITAVLVFLCRRSVSPDREFFYINLGFSPRRLAAGAVFGYFGMDYGRFSEEFPEFSRYHDIRVRSLSPGEIRIAGYSRVLYHYFNRFRHGVPSRAGNGS